MYGREGLVILLIDFDQVLKAYSSSIKKTPNFCLACQYGKSHGLTFPSLETKTTTPLERIHANIWGATPINSIIGYKYYIHFLDDYTRYTWIYPL